MIQVERRSTSLASGYSTLTYLSCLKRCSYPTDSHVMGRLQTEEIPDATGKIFTEVQLCFNPKTSWS